MKLTTSLVAVCAVWSLYLASAEETQKDVPSFCKLFPQEGECGQFHLRWYYNEKRNECYQFMYRGCKGNENNFRDKSECMETCGKPEEKTVGEEDQVEPVDKIEESQDEPADNSKEESTIEKVVENKVSAETASTSSSEGEAKDNPDEEPVFGDDDDDEEDEQDEDEEDEADHVLEDAFSKGILNRDIISSEDMAALKQLVSDLTVYELEEVQTDDAEDEEGEEEEQIEEEGEEEEGEQMEDDTIGTAEEVGEGWGQEVQEFRDDTDSAVAEVEGESSNPMDSAPQEQHLDADHNQNTQEDQEEFEEDEQGFEDADNEMFLGDGDDDDDDDDDNEDDMPDPFELLDQAESLGVFDQNTMSDEDRNALVNIMLQGTTYLSGNDGQITSSSFALPPEVDYDGDEEEEGDDDDDVMEDTEVQTETIAQTPPEDKTEVKTTTSDNTETSADVEPEFGAEEDDEDEDEEQSEMGEVEEILESAEQKGLIDTSVISPDDRETLTNLMTRLSVYELLPVDTKEGDEEDGEAEAEDKEDSELSEQEFFTEGEDVLDMDQTYDALEQYDAFSENDDDSLEMDPFGSVLGEEESLFVTTPPPIYENDHGDAKILEGRPVPPMCFFNADVGPCKAKRRQWFYDFGRQRCMPFYYGGCLGNGNRFKSEAHCMSKCLGGMKIPSVPQSPVKLGPTMKVLEKLGPFKRIPTFLSLLAKPLMNGGKVRITLPPGGQSQAQVLPQRPMNGVVQPEGRPFNQIPSMPRIVPVPPTQQQRPRRLPVPMQRTMMKTPFLPPPSINVPPFLQAKQMPPMNMNEILPKPMVGSPLMEKYPMMKVMFFKKHAPKQYVSPTVSKSNTLLSRHQDSRYQMHASPKNGLSLTQIFVNKPETNAQASPSEMTFKNKGRMDRENWNGRPGWWEDEDRESRRGRRGRKERRMRDEWEDRHENRYHMGGRESMERRPHPAPPSELHHYHHYAPVPPPFHKPPVVFLPPPPPRPPMPWHTPMLPPPNRAHGQFLLQLLAQKRARFGPRIPYEASTPKPEWDRARDYWEDDEEEEDTPQEEDSVDREPPYACLLPVDSGRCKALDRNWYFNKEKGACETFFYGGCGGNANNFKTAEDCRNACLEYVQPDEVDQKVKEEVISIEDGEDEEEEEEAVGEEEAGPVEMEDGQIETSTIMIQEDKRLVEDASTTETAPPMNSPAVEQAPEEGEGHEHTRDQTLRLESGPHYTILLVVVSVVGVLLLILLGVAIVHVFRKSRDTKKDKVLEAVVKGNLYSDLPKFVYAPPPPTPPTPKKESA